MTGGVKETQRENEMSICWFIAVPKALNKPIFLSIKHNREQLTDVLVHIYETIKVLNSFRRIGLYYIEQ